MKHIIQNLSDITDSKEMLEAKPHPVTSVLIYILIVLLVIATLWAYFGEIDTVVKANGIVRPTKTIQSIKNKVYGKVENTYLEDGKKVNKGDILFTIEHEKLTVQKQLNEEELLKSQQEISNLQKYKESINQGINLFDEDNETEYYFKFKQYLTDYKQLELDNKMSNLESDRSEKDNRLTLNNLNSKIEQTEEEISGLKSLKDAVTGNKDMIEEGQELYYQKYDNYKYTIEQYENDIEQKSIAFEELAEQKEQELSKLDKNLESAELAYENAKLDLENYKTKYIADIYASISQNDMVLIDLDHSSDTIKVKEEDVIEKQLYYLDTLKESIEDGENNFNIIEYEDRDDLYREYVVRYYNYNNELTDLRNSKEDLEEDIENVENSINQVSDDLEYLALELDEKEAQLDQAIKDGDQTAIDNLNSEITNIEGEISSKTTLLSNLNSQLDEYEEDLDDFSTSMEEYKDENLKEISNDISNTEDALHVTQVELSGLRKKEQKYNAINEDLTILEQSIEENENLFSEENKEYYNKYEEYKLSVKKLENSILETERSIENIKDNKKDMQANYDKQMKESEILLENSKHSLDEYKNKFLIELTTEIMTKEAMLRDYNTDFAKLQGSEDIYITSKTHSLNSIEKYKIDNIVAINNSIVTNNERIKELQKSLDEINLSIEECIVRAPIDGVINLINEINKGELVESGKNIATIIFDNNANYKVDLFVLNQDIAKLEVGDTIKYKFDALPYTEYGHLNGEITSIGVDSRVDESSGTSYYSVESEMKDKVIYSYKGDRADIKVGMTCEAQVIVDRKKILYYVLEKLNLKQ
ncbi:HlyD family efflux transporter periplasmic adaptor subunit [Sporosalibacterium faouarense]|uniref:HlyD family efflux transporter periplasmic adaptor subunit n=1 Tax=Sporosalibacterium faouarense TaxID=516123 RepID=UPI00192B906F|nr:HlyD family efflux transporter periplasmic adaptor subunit [Sporosalibacterium faouarense]